MLILSMFQFPVLLLLPVQFLKYLFNEKIKMYINYYDIFLLDFLKYVFIDRSFHLSFQNYVYFYCFLLTACLLHENVMFFLFHQKKTFHYKSL